MKYTYEGLLQSAKDKSGLYLCPICKSKKPFKVQGFVQHIKKHGILPKGHKKGKKVVKSEFVKFCPNCGYPVGEINQAVILLAGKT